MKILHVLDRSLPNVAGYAVRSKYILEFQRAIGINVVAITSPEQGGSGEETIDQIRYIRTNMPKKGIAGYINKIFIVKIFNVMKTLYDGIVKIIENESPDIIHAHSPILCGLPALFAARKHNIPLVYEVRALWEDAAMDQGKTHTLHIRYLVTKYLETFLLKRADAVVTICEGLKYELFSRGIPMERIYVIPNCVDTDHFKPITPDAGLSATYVRKDSKIIGFIGSFYKFEGLEVLLRAVPEIVANNGNVLFLIVGTGLEESNLHALAKELKITDHVLFTGKVPHSEIMKYYSIMDVLVYPRLKLRITDMVTPLKPLEAKSMEKAVLVSDVGGLKELIHGERSALCFKAEDVKDLAEKCSMLIKDDALRIAMGKNARLDVINVRNWSKVIQKYQTIYPEILKRRNLNENN